MANDFPFKIPLTVKISGIAAFVLLVIGYMWWQRDKNMKDLEAFYKADINSVIENVGRGSGGWHPIHLTDGRVFRFCPRESYIENQLNKGDTLYKPSMSDTVFIRNNDKRLKLTFLK